MEWAHKLPLLLCNSNSKLNLAPIFYSFSRNAPFSERNILSKGFVFKLKTEGVINFGWRPDWPVRNFNILCRNGPLIYPKPLHIINNSGILKI